MSADRFRPAVTAAAVIERDGRYLLVEEHTPEGLRLNNPAGHLEPGESLLQAVVRKTLEEAACRFTPQAPVGVAVAAGWRGTMLRATCELPATGKAGAASAPSERLKDTHDGAEPLAQECD